MKRLLLLCLFAIVITSCGSSKRIADTNVLGTASANVSGNKIDKIVTHALTFEGTRYKFGGTTKKGMDCSGLVFTSFLKEDILLPRISREMARKGTPVSLRQVEEGDLVFFRTSKNRKGINHVGLVVETRGGVKFIHSTTSKGVIISSLDEQYWNEAFVEVRRII